MDPKPYRQTLQAQAEMQLNQAVAWLNRLERQAVTPISKSLLEKAALPNTPAAQVRELLSKALALSRRYENSLETPEVQVRAALILYAQGDLAGAQSSLQSAADFYFQHGSLHRHAVASLMLGTVDWLADRRVDALAHWREARASLVQCRDSTALDTYRLDHALQGDHLRWYEERLRELEVEEVLIPEQVIGWLNLYEPVSLNLGMGSLLERLYEAVDKKDAPAAVVLAEMVRHDSTREMDPRVTAYMVSQAGAALLMVAEARAAAGYLRQGVGLCPARSHQAGVVAWLKALVEWQIPEQRRDAVVSSRRAMDAFAELALIADRKDLQARKTWYQATRVALVDASERLLKLFAADLAQ